MSLQNTQSPEVATTSVEASSPTRPPAPQEILMQMGSGYWASLILSVALRLNLLEEIQRDSSRSATVIASQLGLDPSSTVRLLRGCSNLGVTIESSPELFRLTDLGQFLTAAHPQSLRDALIMMTDPAHWNSWSELEHTVRTGQPAYQRPWGSRTFSSIFTPIQRKESASTPPWPA